MAGVDSSLLLVGTYTEDFPWGAGHARGVYLFTFEEGEDKKRRLKYSGVCEDSGPNPSYLCHHPGLPLVMVANEINAFEERGRGAVSALRLHKPTSGVSTAPARLSFAGRVAGGTGVCHVNAVGERVCVANYVTGTLASYTVEEEGEKAVITEVATVEHSGGGSNAHAFRQDAAHPHCVTPVPGNEEIVLACDLGQDRVYVYHLTGKEWALQSTLQCTPSSGPRHITMTSDGAFAFIVCELDLSVILCQCDKSSGALTVIQRIEIFAEGLIDNCTAAAIRLSPDERNLYVSTRTTDFIVGFHFSRDDDNTAKLERFTAMPTKGVTARDFAIHPSGEYLIASNGDSDTLIVFAVDVSTGELTEEQIVGCPSPVAVLFA